MIPLSDSNGVDTIGKNVENHVQLAVNRQPGYRQGPRRAALILRNLGPAVNRQPSFPWGLVEELVISTDNVINQTM